MKTKNNLLLTLCINLIYGSLSAGSIFTVPYKLKPTPTIVDISGLDKPTLLAEFYNETELITFHMNLTRARQIFAETNGDVKKISHKRLNINISGNTMDVSPYNKIHGHGKAERIIANLRRETATGRP